MVHTATTSYKVIVPFYIYAAVSLLTATIILFFSGPAFTQHYFHPHTLAITHCMALGWGTMIILGASHQLVPVLIEKKLFSTKLAITCFVFAALGIPLLVYAFYNFNFGLAAQLGGILVNCAVICYLINLGFSIFQSKKLNLQAVFILTATCWLLTTTVIGLFLVYNFSFSFLPSASLHYLSLHASMGIAGWFLLLVMGVGSRLIPMFLISKYNNTKLLWLIYFLINAALLNFIFSFLFLHNPNYLFSIAFVFSALLLFGYYCRQAFKQRIRKHVDEPMKISLLAVVFMLLPLLFLIIIGLFAYTYPFDNKLILSFGFTIFFGWLTAIILGMTFKTLPFIVWNKVYHNKVGTGKTPDPKNLFSRKLFYAMSVAYLAGFVLFTAGILLSNPTTMKWATVLLFATAFLYNLNVGKIITHKPLER